MQIYIIHPLTYTNHTIHILFCALLFPHKYLEELSIGTLTLFFLKILFIYFKQRGREGEREGEKYLCGCLSCTPYWGPGLQPRHVSSLGINPATF